MKALKIVVTFCLLCFLARSVAAASDTVRKHRPWPEIWQLQFAGNIGLVSAGAGYDFFKDNVRVLLVYGYVPERFTGSKAVHLFTLKNTVRVFRMEALSLLTLSPYFGATATLEPGVHSILVLPEHYPKHYYGTTAFHFTGIGGVSLSVKHEKQWLNNLEVFAECVAMDTMLGYRWQNENVNLNRMLSMALGISGRF